MQLRNIAVAGGIWVVHPVIHFTLPFADLLIHGAIMVFLYLGVRK